MKPFQCSLCLFSPDIFLELNCHYTRSGLRNASISFISIPLNTNRQGRMVGKVDMTHEIQDEKFDHEMKFCYGTRTCHSLNQQNSL